MSKSNREKKNKVPKITEAQYEEYIMSLKEETPMHGFDEVVGAAGKPKIGTEKKS